jgi:hypothetical protein
VEHFWVPKRLDDQEIRESVKRKLRPMFHVEHWPKGEIRRFGFLLPSELGDLAVKAEQEDCADDDGGKKDLADMVVEYLLIGVGGVAEVGFFLAGRFGGHLGD